MWIKAVDLFFFQEMSNIVLRKLLYCGLFIKYGALEAYARASASNEDFTIMFFYI